MFLGTNYLGDQQSYRKQLEKIVQRLAPMPVVLLTVTEFAENRREVNDAITLVATEFPNVHLLDWGAIAAADADNDPARRRPSLDQQRANDVGLERRHSAGPGTGATGQLPEHPVHQRQWRQRERQRHSAAEEGRCHQHHRQDAADSRRCHADNQSPHVPTDPAGHAAAYSAAADQPPPPRR